MYIDERQLVDDYPEDTKSDFKQLSICETKMLSQRMYVLNRENLHEIYTGIYCINTIICFHLKQAYHFFTSVYERIRVNSLVSELSIRIINI